MMYRNPKVGLLGLIAAAVIYSLFTLYLYLVNNHDVTLLIQIGLFLVLPVLLIGMFVIYLRDNKGNNRAYKFLSKIALTIFAILIFCIGVYFVFFGLYVKSIFDVSLKSVLAYFLLCSIFLAYPLILIKRSVFQSSLAKFDKDLWLLSFK